MIVHYSISIVHYSIIICIHVSRFIYIYIYVYIIEIEREREREREIVLYTITLFRGHPRRAPRVALRTPRPPRGGGDAPGSTITILYCTVTILYCTVLYYTVLYCTVLYCTIGSTTGARGVARGGPGS